MTAFCYLGSAPSGKEPSCRTMPLHFVIDERSLIGQALFSKDISSGRPHSFRSGGVVHFFVRPSVISAVGDDLEAVPDGSERRGGNRHHAWSHVERRPGFHAALLHVSRSFHRCRPLL